MTDIVARPMIWTSGSPSIRKNAARVAKVLREFGGFSAKKVRPSMFLERGKVFIIGREPVRIDILTSPSGVDFAACYDRRQTVIWDGLSVPLISFDDLKTNKAASGRLKDLADLGRPRRRREQALSETHKTSKKVAAIRLAAARSKRASPS